MEFKDLAPWLAISITLALSILVPLFTQIANNHHQRKMQQEQFDHEKRQKKEEVVATFLSEVGGIVTANGHIEKTYLVTAGSAIHGLYAVVPVDWYGDLDQLVQLIASFKWEEARQLTQKIVRLIFNELNK